MTRDPSRLKSFVLADALVVDVYRATRGFPRQERCALQLQVRGSAISVAANLVEGCAKPSTRDYVHFITIALGSASETRYLLHLASRLDMLEPEDATSLVARYGELVRALQALRVGVLEAEERRRRSGSDLTPDA